MKFGVREICDVTFKATSTGQKIGAKTFKAGQPAFFIDSAKTSSLEQATTTVYAQGGRGNARLIAWEGEKTMTFTVEDALISPQGLAVLSGAGLIEAGEKKIQHVHVTLDKTLIAGGIAEVSLDDLADELGVDTTVFTSLTICGDIPTYATKLDGSGAGVDYYDAVELAGHTGTNSDYLVKVGDPAKFTVAKTVINEGVETKELAKAGETVKLDFYVAMKSGVTNVTIAPEDFGGYYYVEADTLFRAEATGKDMAATITIPKAKVQSAMTFTMASSGDPSTFTFTMDAFPGYTYFDRTKKVMCTIQVVGTDGTADDETFHPHVPADTHEAKSSVKISDDKKSIDIVVDADLLDAEKKYVATAVIDGTETSETTAVHVEIEDGAAELTFSTAIADEAVVTIKIEEVTGESGSETYTEVTILEA